MNVTSCTEIEYEFVEEDSNKCVESCSTYYYIITET